MSFSAEPDIKAWANDVALNPVRVPDGYPSSRALTGYVEATREDDDEKNRLCPPSHYGNSLAEWASMNVLGTRATMSFSAEPDIKAWTDQVALNPARIPPGHAGSAALDDARGRLATHTRPGLARLAELM